MKKVIETRGSWFLAAGFLMVLATGLAIAQTPTTAGAPQTPAVQGGAPPAPPDPAAGRGRGGRGGRGGPNETDAANVEADFTPTAPVLAPGILGPNARSSSLAASAGP